MRTAIVVLLLAGSTATATAGPFKERLSKNQLDAAVKAVQGALAVDKAAAGKCSALPTDSADDKATAAMCYRAAGSLGAAIMIWKTVATQDRASARWVDAIQELGPAYEAAAYYPEAASYHMQYAKRFPDRTDARERAIRAVCMYRQLDDVDAATKGFKFLVKKWKVKTSSGQLCDQVRPIVVPAGTTP